MVLKVLNELPQINAFKAGIFAPRNDLNQPIDKDESEGSTNAASGGKYTSLISKFIRLPAIYIIDEGTE